MCKMRDKFHFHKAPPVVIGSGRGSLSGKFEATVYALFLEGGSCLFDLQKFLAEILVMTTDMGVEHGLGSVPPVPFSSLFPWAETSYLAPPSSIQAVEDDDFDAAFEAEERLGNEVDGRVSLTGSIPCAGQLRILHNAANSLLAVMPQTGRSIEQLAVVADLLRRPHIRTRLLESCFNSEVGKQFHARLNTFRGKVRSERWGTIAFCVYEALESRSMLVFGWNRKRHSGSAGGGARLTADGQHVIETVDAALGSALLGLYVDH